MNEKSSVRGYVFAFLGFLIWGILPIYWHNLNSISSVEILICRIIFSAITLLIYVYISKNVRYINYLKNKSIRNQLILASLLLACNWGLFVYAVNSNHVLQASLGYYINPLFSVLLGVVFLKERLDKIKVIAIVLAAVGVIYMTLSSGEFPYISLALAITFGLYGFMKKKLNLDSYNSLLVETLVLSIVAVIYSVVLMINRATTFSSVNTTEIILIVLSGVATCFPLILFNEGAKRIPLSALGILQYLTPTLMLLVGVFIYGEPFTKVHVVSFIFIWSGYFIYIFSIIFSSRKAVVSEKS